MDPRRPWVGTVFGVVLWLTICGLAGYLAASLGGHGSGVFLLIGAFVGVSGAGCQIAVHFVRPLLSSAWLKRTVVSWGGTMVLSSALCFAAATGHAADAVSSVGFLLIVAALPALVVAGLITWVIGRVAPPPPPIQATRT